MVKGKKKKYVFNGTKKKKPSLFIFYSSAILILQVLGMKILI